MFPDEAEVCHYSCVFSSTANDWGVGGFSDGELSSPGGRCVQSGVRAVGIASDYLRPVTLQAGPFIEQGFQIHPCVVLGTQHCCSLLAMDKLTSAFGIIIHILSTRGDRHS